MKIRFLLWLMVLLLPQVASAQAWRDDATTTGTTNCKTGLNPTGRKTCYYRVDGTSTTDSDVINVTACAKISVELFQSDFTDLEAKGFLMSAVDAAKTLSGKLLADLDGGGIGSSDNVAMDGDRGADEDQDGTARNTSSWILDSPPPYIFIDVTVDAEAGDYAIWQVTCRG